jgi:multiple sugar transport system permease protein
MNSAEVQRPPEPHRHQGLSHPVLHSSMRYLRRNGWIYLGALVLVAVVGGPFYWMLVSSLKTQNELLAQPPTLFPQEPVLTAYGTLIDTGFMKYLRNSLIVSLTTVVITTILGTCAGYSLARFNYPGRRLIGQLLLFSYLFPGVLLMVPMYILASRAGLLDSLVALPIVYVTFSAPFFSWILKAFFEGIPYDIEEAALIDGASRWQTIWRIMVPLSAPGVAAAALWTFIMSWSEYMFAVVLISSDEKMTLPIGLARWISFQFKDWSVMNAGGVISLLPVLILFAFLGRAFISGLTAGSTK